MEPPGIAGPDARSKASEVEERPDVPKRFHGLVWLGRFVDASGSERRVPPTNVTLAKDYESAVLG